MSSSGAFKLNGIKSLGPYIFKSLSSGLIMCAGDILSQIYVEKRDWREIQNERTVKFASIGFLFTGPLLARWSFIMQRSIVKTKSLTTAFHKTLSTQIFLAPPLNFGIITVAGALNGAMPTKTSIRDILQGDFLSIMESNYIVWLPVQFAGCIIRYPVVKFVVTSFVSIFWFAYLSSILMD